MRKHNFCWFTSFRSRLPIKLTGIVACAAIWPMSCLAPQPARGELVDPLAEGPTGQVVFGDEEEVEPTLEEPAAEQPATEQPSVTIASHQQSRNESDDNAQPEARLAQFQSL